MSQSLQPGNGQITDPQPWSGEAVISGHHAADRSGLKPMEWDPARIRALRAALRLPQEKFAERLGAAPRTVGSWEAGKHPPSLALLRALDDALESASAEQKERFLALLAPGHEDVSGTWHSIDESRRADPEGEEAPTDRRQAMRSISGLAGMMVSGAHVESLDLVRQAEASDLGPATLDRLELAVERFGLEYLHTPLLETFEEVRSCRLYVARLLEGRHTLAERARLYGVAGRLSAVLSYLAIDLGQAPAVTHSHCATALHLAADAGHRELTAWVRGTQAMTAVFDGRPQEAVAFCDAGREVVPAGSASAPRLWAQQARAYARMGERASAERAMGAAETAFANLSRAPTRSIFSFESFMLPYYAGTAYVWLREPERAQGYAEQTIALNDAQPADYPVSRVVARIDLADSLAQQGELEGAAGLAVEALNICASGRRTYTIAKRAAEFLATLHSNRGLPAVRDLEERFRTLFSGTRWP